MKIRILFLAAALLSGACGTPATAPSFRTSATVVLTTGLNDRQQPVNAVEAESRRGRRFEATGFTAGALDLSDIREKQARQSTDVGAPGILDLRRVRTVLH